MIILKKIISIIFCLIILFSFSACKGSGNNNQTDENNGIYTLFEGIYISEILPYSGSFVEDGSDESVENIMSVKIKNESEKNYQFFDFSLMFGNEEYKFSVKTLLSGSTVTVLEKDRKNMPENTDEINSKVTDLAYFEIQPSLYSDIFEISGAESIINVKNISADDVENVIVYYKNVTEDGYLGGVTYRAEFGNVPAGEIIQTVSSKYLPGKSEVVFVTYVS